MFSNLIWQVSQIYREYYLATWSSIKNISRHENNKKIIWFIVTSIPGILSVYLRQVFMAKGFIKYNINMHDKLINTLINAPINLFHDITPRGNILNRLNKELNNSNIFSLAISGSIRAIVQLLGSIFLCLIFNIYTFPVIIIIIIIELSLTKFCYNATQDIHKLESNYRSPIIGVFSETILGLPIIRAFKYENSFIKKILLKNE